MMCRATKCPSLMGTFVFDFMDGHPEQIDCGGIVVELAAVLDDLAELVVQRLDAVGGVDDLASRCAWRGSRRLRGRGP